MRNWLYGIIGALPGFLRKPLGWILDRIWSVFDDGLRFARWIKYGVQKLNGAGKNLIRALRSALDEIYWTCKWLVLTYVPRLAKGAFDNAIRWAGGTIDWLNKTLRAVISAVDDALRKSLNALKGWAEKAVKWLTDNVNQLFASVKKLLDRVFGLWATPMRLAEWLVGAMWTVFLRFLYSNRDRIAQWFLRSSVAFTRWLALELERVIGRLL